MSLANIVVLCTLTMVTIAHADHGRPECQVVYVYQKYLHECQKYLYECQMYKTKHEYKFENKNDRACMLHYFSTKRSN